MSQLSQIEAESKIQLELAYRLTEGKVDPRVIREMTVLAELVEREKVPLFETPEAVIVLSLRECRLREGQSFNDVLLDRLAILRAKRSNKPKEIAMQIILDGY
jgi:hypothetical protein